MPDRPLAPSLLLLSGSLLLSPAGNIPASLCVGGRVWLVAICCASLDLSSKIVLVSIAATCIACTLRTTLVAAPAGSASSTSSTTSLLSHATGKPTIGVRLRTFLVSAAQVGVGLGKRLRHTRNHTAKRQSLLFRDMYAGQAGKRRKKKNQHTHRPSSFSFCKNSSRCLARRFDRRRAAVWARRKAISSAFFAPPAAAAPWVLVEAPSELEPLERGWYLISHTQTYTQTCTHTII